MRAWTCLLLLAGGCGVADPYRPAAIRTEGVPPVPEELAERLARYTEIRGTSFQGWGDDGSMLVARREGEVTQLHLVTAPGGALRQLTRGADPARGGVLVPGAGDLVFPRGTGGDEQYQIHRRDASTGAVTRLTDGRGRCLQGPLTRAGDALVYLSNRADGRDMDLYRLDLRTGRSTLLKRSGGAYWIPSDWSPDDSKLLLRHYVSVNVNRVLMLDVKSGALKEWTEEGARVAESSPRFAADAKGVYYATDGHGRFKQLAYRDLATGAERLQPGIPWDVVDIEIHGDRVAFVTNENGTSRLSVMEDGIVSRPKLPAGSVSGVAFSRDGRALGFTLSPADAPSDAYALDLATGRVARWTTSDTGRIDPATFTAPEPFHYESFDGLEIPAFLYRPRGVAKPPVVVYIHGGPESQYRPRFSSTFQFWLRELGVAVIAPNVRGSAGYGKDYVALDNGMKREDSVKDIGALLDWIGKQPDLDGSRVAVYGGSYGGYMVLASLVRYGDRLRAGVDIVGIANFVTFLERTSRYRVDLRRVEYGDERDPGMRAFLERISPSNHASRIRSALFLAHGANDPRVKLFETELITGKVRAAGRPAWTVIAGNEGHGFARKENRAYLSAAVAMFLRRHLLE